MIKKGGYKRSKVAPTREGSLERKKELAFRKCGESLAIDWQGVRVNDSFKYGEDSQFYERNCLHQATMAIPTLPP